MTEAEGKKRTSCPTCGSTKLVRDYEHGELVCAGCGYVIAERIMDLGPEWRAFDQEQRDKRGRVGAPMTFSVDYSEPIILEKDGEVRIVPIGEWVDSIIGESGKVEGGVEMAPVSGYRTVAFDEGYRLRWAPISHVTRHPVHDLLYEVELEDGRRVRVTGSHSLYTVEEGKVVPVEVEKLREGDFVAVPKILPEPGLPPRELNLALAKVPGSFVLDGGELPLEVSLKGFEGNGGARIRPHVCLEGLPLRVPVDERLGALLGYYVSKGCVTSRGVSFTFGPDEEECAEETIQHLRGLFGLEASLHLSPSSLVVDVGSRALALLLDEVTGGEGRRVPPFLFTSPPAARRAFLRACRVPALWDGGLGNDLAYLSLFEGTSGSKVVSPTRQVGQLAFLRVRRISRVKSTNGYAYDVTVPGYLNFVGGRGAVCLHDTIHDKGLSTMIDWRDRDSYGKDLTPKRRAQIYRLRKWQRRIRVSDAIERNLAFALSEIDRMASHLSLPRNVRETAAVIYRRAVEEKLIRGRSIEGVAGAALYAACRECKVPRTLDEIAEVSRVSKKEISRSYRFIARELLIHLHPTSPADYVPRFASELGLSGEVQSKAIEILKEAVEKGLTSGRGPTGVTAAAIYIAAQMLGERRTQREVADVARVTEVTVRNRYKELCEKLGLNCEKLG